MIRSSKSLLGLSLIACFAASQANACAITAWDAVGAAGSVGVVAADAVAVQEAVSPRNARYSGSCSLKLTGASKFVQNTIATPRSTYKARFYVRKDATGAGSEVFKATNAAGTTNVITVTYTGTTFSFNLAGAPTQPASVTVPSATAWYSVTLDWTNAGAFTATVVGAGGQASTPATATATVSTAETIGKARLGNTNATAAGTYFFEEFDSRTTAVPPRLCRGDANNSNSITNGDAQAVVAEIPSVAVAFASGQPDCNESGGLTFGDAQCIAARVGTNCATNP